MNDNTLRVRKAIEQEFGPQSDVEYLGLIANTLLDIRAAAPREKGEADLFRTPTTPEDADRITQQYPKSIETVVRELAVYNLIAKRDGKPVEGVWRFGVAVAIIDHILKAGEIHEP